MHIPVASCRMINCAPFKSIHNGCLPKRAPLLRSRVSLPHRCCRRGPAAVHACASPPAAPAVDSKDAVNPWKVFIDKQQNGEVIEGEIIKFNKGGVILKTGEVEGFIPFSKLAQSRLQPGDKGDYSYLIGQRLQAKIISVDPQGKNGRGDLILSEQEDLAKGLGALAIGDVVTATVRSVQPYGAFVGLHKVVDKPDAEVEGVVGLVHISQLGWSRVMNIESVVTVGQEVQAKVLTIDMDASRLGLSIKALQPDPLKQTVDNVMPPQKESNGEKAITWREAQQPLLGVAEIMRTLKQVEGITTVTLQRQADLKGSAVQELEVWLTKDEVEDGFNVVVREGAAMQELHLSTRMSRNEVKEALKALLKPRKQAAALRSMEF